MEITVPLNDETTVALASELQTMVAAARANPAANDEKALVFMIPLLDI
jgi:hypothetical protein